MERRHHRRSFRFPVLLVVVAAAVFARSSVAADSTLADQYRDDGAKAVRRGAFEEAVLSWTEAERLYGETGTSQARIDTLIDLARAYGSLGRYSEALTTLERARQLAEDLADRDRIASILASLGNISIATGRAETAEAYLNQALRFAREVGNRRLVASILLDRGNVCALREQLAAARDAYHESIALARGLDDHALLSRALTNAGATARDSSEALGLLDEAAQQIAPLAVSHEKAYGLISIAHAYTERRGDTTDLEELVIAHAFEQLNEAVAVAETLGDARAATYAWGDLGSLYERRGRHEEALELTRRAILAAQAVNAPEALYRWQWQSGRLLSAQGNVDGAVSAYRLAVSTLESIRYEFLNRYGGVPRSSFRESAAPLFLETVDLLLRRARTVPESEASQYLGEARQVIELLQMAELRDYFRDDCVDAAQFRIARLDMVSPAAAVLYPIPLGDRTELLVSIGGKLKSFPVAVGAEALTQQIEVFRKALEKRTTREYLVPGRILYDWLVRPLEVELSAAGVDTIVLVPHGALRTIPLAALHDGQHFLIQRYAVAVTPGLDLTDPRPLQRQGVRVFMGGLSEAVGGFPPLRFVRDELERVEALYRGTLLLNSEFSIPRIEKELAEQRFTIVHFASHAEFQADVANTFVLTFDGKLSMDRLARMVRPFQFRENGLDLMILSACETAAGDDRAALGLAGVAVKAGAKSALATLWYVNDEASSLLVVEFYRQLQDASISKAIALQRAQLKLLDDPRYRHPGYWSPYLLINNWL
jgi:CHAT domain-containing protein